VAQNRPPRPQGERPGVFLCLSLTPLWGTGSIRRSSSQTVPFQIGRNREVDPHEASLDLS
jgi:hypothetical protein